MLSDYLKQNESTDWSDYFSRKVPEKTFVSRATNRLLISYIEEYSTAKITSITELGGAGSRSFGPIVQALSPKSYYLVDNNVIGLELIKKRVANNHKTKPFFICADVLSYKGLSLSTESDLVFSLGLIEHFSEENTKKAIETHFKACRSGGLVVISFPTPTLVYVICRKFAEIIKKWHFHDERPLRLVEVSDTVSKFGNILDSRIIWRIGFTQYMVVAKKK